MEPNRFQSSISTGRQGTKIDAGLRSYMMRVYNYMAMGVGLTGVVIMLMANSPELLTLAVKGWWVLLAALFGMGWFSPKILSMRNTALAQLYFWSYAALWGVLISPTVVAFLNIEGGVEQVARAFLITTAMFLGTSIYGYTTKKDLSGMAQFLVMAIIGLFIAAVANVFFFESTGFAFMASFGFVLLFAGMTAYETQFIKDMYTHNAGAGGDTVTRMAVFGALMIYGNFVVMFINLLQMLGFMQE